MSFFEGLVGGIAQGASRTIGTILDKREEEASAARKYMQQRNIQKAEQYEAEKAEMESLVNAYADLTGGDIRKASQLIKGAGNIDRANARLEMLSLERERNENFDINKLYTFAETETNSDDPYTVGEFVENLVGMPTFAKIPESRKFGLGLADKFLPKAEQIALPERTGREFEIGTATMIPGTTTTAEEYKRETESERLALATSKAGLLKLEKEISNLGGLTKAEGRTYWKESVSEAVNLAKLPLNKVTGEFDLSTAPEKLQEARDAYGNALVDTIRYFKDTGTVNTADGQNQLKSFARNPFIDINRNDAGKAFTPLTEEGGFDYSKMELGKVYGVGTPAGETAKYLFAGFDDEDKPLMFQLQ